MARWACYRLTKSVYDMCTGQPVASRQALVASSMVCLACHRLTLKSVYDMCGFCFIGFLWGEKVYDGLLGLVQADSEVCL